MELRDYQQRVVDAFANALASGVVTPCVSVATGGGKSLIVSTLAQRFTSKGRRTMAVSHVRELIDQLQATAQGIGLTPSIYAASYDRRETDGAYTIAQVQSVYKRMLDMGRIDAIIIDEVHLLGDSEDGMYRRLIADAKLVNPDVRVLGLSATPWRTKSGLIYGKNRFFQECVAHVGMRELIEAGYLTPLVGKSGDRNPGLDDVKIRGGDFIASELEKLMADEARVERAVKELVRHTTDRHRVLVFSSGRKHNAMIVDALRKAGQHAECVDGTMSDDVRDGTLTRFRSGDFKYLVNAQLLTTGYDDPHIDAVVLLRPTRSPGLLLQMVGRGLRKADGKENCLVLDFGSCIETFGPLDRIEERIKRKNDTSGKGAAPQKVCPECDLIVYAGVLKCPGCGYVWPKAVARHDTAASGLAPLSTMKAQTLEVRDVTYRLHKSKADKPDTLCVQYKAGLLGICEYLSIDRESHSYARSKALAWVRQTPTQPYQGKTLDTNTMTGQDGGTMLTIDSAALLLAFVPCLIKPTHIDVIPQGKYWNVVKRHFAKQGVA